MLTLPTTVRVFAATEPVDGRKGIDGLAGVVRAALQRDPLNGDLYLFLSRRRDRARVLCFANNGYWLLIKRLERGRFHLPWEPSPEAHSRPIDHAELLLLLEGIDLRGTHHRPAVDPA